MADDLPKRRLGRGLAALIGDVGEEPGAERPRAAPPRTLPVAFLRPNPRNPRKTFDAGELDALADSIREKGLVQPIVVRPVEGAGPDAYEIIAGERRWRAAQKAGLHDVPVIIRQVSDKEALEIAIVENVQRADLNPIEEAEGYQHLIDGHGYTQGELADVIGKSRPHIANTLRLLRLPEGVRAHVLSGALTAGHARAIVTLDDPEAAARRIIENGMSVRDVEVMAGSGRERRTSPKAAAKDADTRALEKSLSDILGLEVTIAHRPSGGSVRIAYRTLEQLDEVCRRLRK